MMHNAILEHMTEEELRTYINLASDIESAVDELICINNEVIDTYRRLVDALSNKTRAQQRYNIIDRRITEYGLDMYNKYEQYIPAVKTLPKE